jgi:cytoskeletal protein CcmA (bactofilin family)
MVLGAPVRRRLRTLVLVCVLVCSLATGVAAAESVQGVAGTVVVGADETVDGVEAVAGTLIVRGTVTGDVSAAAGTVHVTETGRVGGDVEVAAGAVRIDGRVDGDVSAGAGTFDVTETARIGGHVEAGAGYASVDGRIGGDVTVGAETVVLGPNAQVGGDVRYDAATLTRDPGATVEGSVVRETRGQPGGTAVVGTVLGAVYELLANLLFGVILLFAFPDFSAGVASRVGSSPVRTGGVGLLALVGVPVGLVLLVITLVGIPLAAVGAVAFAGAVWAGLVYGQYAVGVRALAAVDRGGRWSALVGGLVGFALLGAVPVLGGLLELGALLLGLGALVLGLRDAYRHRSGDGPSDRQSTLDEAASS